MKNGMVIVNYNDADTTIRLLNNIRNYNCLDTIVVVDNKSTDDSLTKLHSLKLKKVIVIETKENKGYSYALNIGAKHLIDLYNECNIVFSNSDIIIDSEQDLITLLNDLSSLNVIVAPNVLEDNTISRGWHIPGPWQDVILNMPGIRKNYFNKHLKYADSYYKNHLSKVETVSGCFFLMTSKHLQDINYFDEGVFLYYEENIMGAKTKLLKKNIVIDNDVDVVHDHSVSIDKSLKRIKKFNILKKSQLYFERKYNHANIFELLFLIVTAFVARLILSIKYLLD